MSVIDDNTERGGGGAWVRTATPTGNSTWGVRGEIERGQGLAGGASQSKLGGPFPMVVLMMSSMTSPVGVVSDATVRAVGDVIHDVITNAAALRHRGHEVAHCSAPPGGDVVTRCQADDLTQLPGRAYVMVTGSSRSGPVRFLDAMLSTKLIGGRGLGVSDGWGGACVTDGSWAGLA